MKVEVLNSHPYAGIQRAVGEIYEMEDRFVKVMQTMGQIRPLVDEDLQSRDMNSSKPGKAYKRRDMKAVR
jgi:hypothetical protein